LAIPSEKQLTEALTALLNARPDGQPVAAWPGVRIRRYRDVLRFFAEQDDPLEGLNQYPERHVWDTDSPLTLGGVRGTLAVAPVEAAGLPAGLLAQGVTVRFRQGGERIRPGPKGRERDLKNLLQESGVAPWMRGHIPLLYSGDDLLAVADLWVNADFAVSAGQPGYAIIWRDHAALS
jgi:tRNA(Ile)-lysidine synthase